MNKWSPEAIRAQLHAAIGAAADTDDTKSRTRRRILKAATAQFVRFGYRRASVSEIAREAGVAKGTVYLYFESKADMVWAAMAQEKLDHLPRLLEVFNVAPHLQLRTYLEMSAQVAVDMPLITRLIRGDHEIMAVLDDIAAPAREQYLTSGDEFLILMLRSHEPRWSEEELAERAIVVRLLAMFAAQLDDDGLLQGLPPSRFASIFADIVSRGVVKPEETE